MQLRNKVKINFYEGTPPIYGRIAEVIHPAGPAWPAFYKINVGTTEKPVLHPYYEYGETYELELIHEFAEGYELNELLD